MDSSHLFEVVGQRKEDGIGRNGLFDREFTSGDSSHGVLGRLCYDRYE